MTDVHKKTAPPSRVHVKDVHQVVNVSPHGELFIDEDITVDYGKTVHPFFIRSIPTLARHSGHLVNLDVNVKGVYDQKGQTLAFRSKPVQAFEVITVGDSRSAMTGVQHFRLSYAVSGAVNNFSARPELDYSALGPRWQEPIDKVTVDVNFAPGQGDLLQKAVAYSGSTGARKKLHLIHSANHAQIVAENLAPGQDLVHTFPLPTRAVVQSALPAGLADGYQIWHLAYILPAATLLVLILLWFFFGSDQRSGKAPPFNLANAWEPPSELTPAECGTIVDESCDDKDILITIFGLAERGYIAIRETPNHGLKNYGSKDYEFSQPPQPIKGALKAHEELLINVIFTGRNKAYLSDMDGYLRDYLPIFRRQVQDTMTADRYFARNPQADRDHFVMSGCFAAGCGALLYAYSAIVTDVYKMASVGLIISGALIFTASSVMPKRTRRGVAAVEQIHKFEHFILHAGDDDIDKLYRTEANIFYRLLPYAMVQNMGEFWADRFKHHVRVAPPWYTTMESLQGEPFDVGVFARDLGHCLREIGRTAVATERAKNPQASPTISARDL